MDGNGRWAQAKGQPRSAGHLKGVETVRTITEEAVRTGIKYLTLYTFSTENWNRPAQEVEMLMTLFFDELEREKPLFVDNNVRLAVIGDTARLPQKVQQRMNDCINAYSSHTGMTLVIAMSYSSRWEITNACQLIAQKAAQGLLDPATISEDTISAHLCTANIPDPDLLIRTGGEIRISNYLLWQCAYTEFYFTPVLWPDFDATELHNAITHFQSRQRRYGKTGEQIKQEEANA